MLTKDKCIISKYQCNGVHYVVILVRIIQVSRSCTLFGRTKYAALSCTPRSF